MVKRTFMYNVCDYRDRESVKDRERERERSRERKRSRERDREGGGKRGREGEREVWYYSPFALLMSSINIGLNSSPLSLFMVSWVLLIHRASFTRRGINLAAWSSMRGFSQSI